jgi:hypothetical protein
LRCCFKARIRELLCVVTISAKHDDPQILVTVKYTLFQIKARKEIVAAEWLSS